MSSKRARVSILLVAALAVTSSSALAQWVEYVDDSANRMVSDSAVGLGDNREKDYAWADVDLDGDVDLVVVRKQPFTSPGKNTNVLFINQNGVLTDRTGDFATDSSVGGDNGFLTPTNDRDVIFVDVNLDGWMDMITATTISDSDPKHIGHPRVYMNKGCTNGGTSASSCSTALWLGFKYEEPRIPEMLSYSGNSGFNPRFCSVSAGDVNGDGYPDLYFGDYDSSGAGGSGQPPGADYNDKLLINQGAFNPGFFTDVTSDAGRFAGEVPGVNQSFEISAFGAANGIRDMNGDTHADIIKQTSLNAPTYVGVAYNDSTPTLGFFDTYDLPQVPAGSPYFVSVNDLNNDNLLDLVITDDGADRYLLQQPAGGFVPDFISFPFSFSHSGVGGPSQDDGFGGNSLISDLDKDGWDDVLITDVDVDIGGCTRRMHIYRNLAGSPGDTVILQEQTSGSGCEFFQGNPATCIVATIPSNKLEGVHDVAVFDLNGDSFDDLVVGRCNTTEIYLAVPSGEPAGSISDYDEADLLQLDKGALGSLAMNWGASCLLDDSDYAIYEGSIAAPFDSHSIKTCSTSGATSALISPSGDSSYYLVVPNNGVFEGDYGQDSNHVPRSQGTSECFPKNTGPCL